MYWGYFQSFTICIFLPPLLVVMKLARRKGAWEALQEEVARHCYFSRAKIQKSRVRGWRQGHCWVGWRKKGKDEQTMLLVRENLNLMSSQSLTTLCTTAPPNWKHSFQNIDLLALLVFIKHSFVIQFSLTRSGRTPWTSVNSNKWSQTNPEAFHTS